MYPLPTPPLIHCLPTPISLWKDMERKIFKGQNYLIWLKSHKHSMSSGNALRIAVVPENPLRKVKAHRCTAGHDPTRVRTNIVKRNNVQVILVRPPYNINIHHYINEASTVWRISMAPWRFKSASTRVTTIIPLHRLPRLELFEVLHNPCLKTQVYTNKYFIITYAYANTIISTHL